MSAAVASPRPCTATLRTALPELADTVPAEPGWDALAATLADAERAGHDPRNLLAEAAARQELDTAESISDALVWRLRCTADLPAHAPVAAPTTKPQTTTPHQNSAHRPALATPRAHRR